MTASFERKADAAEEVLEVPRAMDSAVSGGDGDAFGDLWLLMNSHARPIEKVT